MAQEPLLKVKDLATALGVSLATAYLLVAQGHIVSHRVGRGRGTIRIRPESVDAYLEARRHGTPGYAVEGIGGPA